MAKIPGFVLTPEQRKIVEAVRAEAERDRPEIIAEGRRVEAAMQIATVHLRNAFSLLQALRKAQGMTLTALAEATKIDKSTLSRLENDPTANVTLSTLTRVAEALNCDLQVSIVPRAIPPMKPRIRKADAAAQRLAKALLPKKTAQSR